MSNNRREFLNNLGLGVIGSAALAFPAQALAFGRRHRSCAPVCVEEVHHWKPKGYYVVGPFTFSFPLSDGGSSASPVFINGAGAFSVWGGYSTNDVDAITDFQLVDTSTTSVTIRRSVSQGSITANATTMGKFAFFIPAVPGGVAADLTANIFRMRFVYVKGTTSKTETTGGFFKCSTDLDS